MHDRDHVGTAPRRVRSVLPRMARHRRPRQRCLRVCCVASFRIPWSARLPNNTIGRTVPTFAPGFSPLCIIRMSTSSDRLAGARAHRGPLLLSFKEERGCRGVMGHRIERLSALAGCADRVRRAAGAALLVTTSALFAVPRTAAPNAGSGTGAWFVDGTGAALQIFECIGLLCGRIVWFQKARDSIGAWSRDQKNRIPRSAGARVRLDHSLRTSAGWP